MTTVPFTPQRVLDELAKRNGKLVEKMPATPVEEVTAK
jgi:hypothetical protein